MHHKYQGLSTCLFSADLALHSLESIVVVQTGFLISQSHHLIFYACDSPGRQTTFWPSVWIEEYSLLIFQIPAVSCLARWYLRTYLPMFCGCLASKVLVEIGIYSVYVYRQGGRWQSEEATLLSVFHTLAVSCLVRRDLRTYLPMFRENSRLSELVYWAHYVWEFITCSSYL